MASEKNKGEVKMKKLLLSLLVMLLAVTTVFAGGAAEAAEEDGGLIRVGIINNDPNESGYRTANDNDMKAMFTEENGYDASFFYSLRNDEQIAAAQNFIQNEVDYLLISAAGTAGWDSVLQDAQNAGIYVILFDRTIDADESLYVASIVSDMALEGETAVNWLASQGLDEYNIIHIQGVMGSAAQIGRTGALDEMVAANDNWNLVTQQTAEWNAETAQQIVQSVIDAGTPFNVIYAENDDMARGAVLEEIGDSDSALLDYLAAAETVDFPFVGQAYLNAGAVEEVRGNSETARVYYNKVIENSPYTTLSSLAHSRLIVLDIEAE